jgi:hypothetical protein
MIKTFILIRVDCDCCGKFYPSTKNPIHFQDDEDANKTAFEAGWKIIDVNPFSLDKAHYCPSCVKAGKDSNIVIP